MPTLPPLPELVYCPHCAVRRSSRSTYCETFSCGTLRFLRDGSTLRSSACKRGSEARTSGLRAFAERLLHPDDLGFACTPEIRDAARVALGRAPTETTPSPAAP